MKYPIPFLRAGEKPHSLPQTNACRLSTASDWQRKVELGKQIMVPEHITLRRHRAGDHVGANGAVGRTHGGRRMRGNWQSTKTAGAEPGAGGLTVIQLKWALLAVHSPKLWQGLE